MTLHLVMETITNRFCLWDSDRWCLRFPFKFQFLGRILVWIQAEKNAECYVFINDNHIQKIERTFCTTAKIVWSNFNEQELDHVTNLNHFKSSWWRLCRNFTHKFQQQVQDMIIRFFSSDMRKLKFVITFVPLIVIVTFLTIFTIFVCFSMSVWIHLILSPQLLSLI